MPEINTTNNDYHVTFDIPSIEDIEWEFNIPFTYRYEGELGWWCIFDWQPAIGDILHSNEFAMDFTVGASIILGGYYAYRVNWVNEPRDEMPVEWEDSEPELVSLDDGYSVEREEAEDSGTAPSINTNIGRRVPLISFEQEFSGDGDLVSRELHEAGFAYSRYADGYHGSEMRHRSVYNTTNAICYVETDSSCGYELIYDRLDLTNREVALRFHASQKILRDLKEQDRIRLSARCGFHIHVDVSNWSMVEIVSAYHLWNYLEDTIFRFASSHWPSHRDEEVGGGYSSPVPKGYQGKIQVGTRLAERRDALNFSHILRAKANCSCGAGYYEDWANCTCNLAQPTLEFRVFNATLNQRKIKAYAAFAIGFVNLAGEREINPSDYPVMRWRGTDIRAIVGAKSWEKASEERMNFILDEFSLTSSEKADIQYCFRNSSLELAL